MRQPEFWSRKDLVARALGRALSPFGAIYGATVAWKHRRQNPYRSRAGVICVGNLTVGGSGKTPVAIAVAQMLQAKGYAVVFLSRGYGRSSSGAMLVDAQKHDAATVGDEPLLLAEIAPTVVARDRSEGARLAERAGADIIVMDDGHQNFTLAKDLSLVVVDGEYGFGNERIIPAGPLREPVAQGLARADAIVVMGDGAPPLSDFARPIFRARLSSDARFGNEPLIAFAGIGRPDKFFADLRARGANLVETHGFPDHHVYSASEIATLRDRARNLGARLMTTEKDFMRLGSAARDGVSVFPVKAVLDDTDAVERFLAPMLTATK
jgi:tetraacyldisaccharide 4'-kinase